MTERRNLVFTNLDEMMPEVDRLLAGHITVGKWSLGQTCNHLATVFNLLVDGVPNYAPPTRLVRVGNWFARKWFFSVDWFPTGVKAPSPLLIPRPGLDDRVEADALRVALARFSAATGPFPAHPYLGLMTKDEWVRFNCRHCAHHLRYVLPNGPGIVTGTDTH